MLTTLLPWAALVVAILALLSREGPRTEAEDSPEGVGKWLFFGVLAAVLALGAGYFWRDAVDGLWPTSVGFAGGAGVAVLSLLLGGLKSQPANAFAAPVAVGAFGTAIWTLVDIEAREPYQLGAAAGIGLVGWLLSGGDSLWPGRTGIVAVLCLFADVLGHRAAGGHVSQAGSVFGVLIAVAVLLALGIPKRPESETRNRLIGFGAAAAVLVLGAWLLAGRHFFLNDLWILLAGGAAVGLIVSWLVPEDSSSGSGFVLSVIIWLAAATLAFGLRKGFGMSVTTLGGLAMLLCLGRTRALLTLGPLAMLVTYRVFRELHTDASRALDIGQHYALIGIVAGAAIVALATEWRSSEAGKSPLAGLLWLPLFIALPYVSGVVLAAKGFVGVIAGLGFGPFVEGLRGSSRQGALSLQLGLGAALAGGYGWLSDKVDLARDEKVGTLISVSVGAAVLAAIIALLSRKEAPAASGSSA